jgi:hypothetical protein
VTNYRLQSRCLSWVPNPYQTLHEDPPALSSLYFRREERYTLCSWASCVYRAISGVHCLLSQLKGNSRLDATNLHFGAVRKSEKILRSIDGVINNFLGYAVRLDYNIVHVKVPGGFQDMLTEDPFLSERRTHCRKIRPVQ